MVFSRLATVTALAALGISCHNVTPPAIDPALAARIPPGAMIVAGVNLKALRASPVRQQLPSAIAPFLEPLHDADTLLVASNGSQYLALARGLAPTGSADWPHPTGTDTTPALLALAEPLAASSEIWMVVSGAAKLPLTGNGDNLNGLLHATRYTTLTIHLADTTAIEVVGNCSGVDPARQLEETVRALLTLGAAASGRQTPLGVLLKRIRLTREDRAVHLNLTANAEELQQLLKLFS